MLPFTKRPGRDDGDAVANDEPSTGSAKRTPTPPPGQARDRRSFAPNSGPNSRSEDELTTMMPTKSLGSISGLSAAHVMPRPASTPPAARTARTTSARTVSGRSRPMIDDEEDDGARTMVRGAPKIIKRGAATKAQSSVSPAAVIKATLEQSRKGKRDDVLRKGPPRELLEDEHDHDISPGSPAERTVLLDHTGSSMAPSITGPVGPVLGGMHTAPVPMARPQPQPSAHSTHARPSPSQPPQGAPYNYSAPVPLGSVSSASTAMPSMPAHFMVPQAPYSDGRIDPPGTAITARTRIVGRPAATWAAALLALGLVVGVSAVALARSRNDGAMETTASFVDPSRAAVANAGPGSAGPGFAPSDVNPVGAMPVGAAPVGAAPVGAAPVGAAPVGAAPVGAAPVGAAPVGAAPVGAAPVPAGNVPRPMGYYSPYPVAPGNAGNAPAPAPVAGSSNGNAPPAFANPRAAHGRRADGSDPVASTTPPKKKAHAWRPAPAKAAPPPAGDEAAPPVKAAPSTPAKKADAPTSTNESKKMLDELKKLEELQLKAD